MCITDIDDKTIRDSQKSGKSLKEFTEFYTQAFLEDCKKLSIVPADNIMPISRLIDDMGVIINTLISKGYAYLAEDGSVYYSVSKFKDYGKLAHLDFEGMISSVRIDNDEYDKDQVADFALWKSYDPLSDGENSWNIEVTIEGETKILKGRPGWHIECSACNRHFFGDQIDIHMGGVDLLFPHHQNEVAQTEACTGKPFSKYWLHGGHLLVDNKKMAKSAHNFYTLRDIVWMMDDEWWELKAVNGESEGDKLFKSNESRKETSEANEFLSPSGPFGTFQSWKVQHISEKMVYRGFRLMALQNQYRENFNFTFERLSAAINTVKGLDEMMKRLGRYLSQIPLGITDRNAHGKMKFHDISREFRDNQQAFMQDFIEKLEDDFDTNTAMTIVFEYQSYINAGIDDDLFSLEESKSIIALLRSWDEVLALFDFTLLEDTEVIPNEIQALGADRAEAKIQKNWAEADRIRDELLTLGWKLIDETGGKWRVEKV